MLIVPVLSVSKLLIFFHAVLFISLRQPQLLRLISNVATFIFWRPVAGNVKRKSSRSILKRSYLFPHSTAPKDPIGFYHQHKKKGLEQEKSSTKHVPPQILQLAPPFLFTKNPDVFFPLFRFKKHTHTKTTKLTPNGFIREPCRCRGREEKKIRAPPRAEPKIPRPHRQEFPPHKIGRSQEERWEWNLAKWNTVIFHQSGFSWKGISWDFPY